MVDKVKPLKLESPALGGTEADMFPRETDPTEDYLASKGVSFENSDTEKMDLSADINVQTLSFAAVLMQKNLVPAGGKEYVISSAHQLMFFDELQVDGALTVYGDLVGLG